MIMIITTKISFSNTWVLLNYSCSNFCCARRFLLNIVWLFYNEHILFTNLPYSSKSLYNSGSVLKVYWESDYNCFVGLSVFLLLLATFKLKLVLFCEEVWLKLVSGKASKILFKQDSLDSSFLKFVNKY